MPLDPKAQALLDARNALGNPPYRSMTVEAVRTMTIQQSAALNKRKIPVAEVADRTIPGPAGPLRVRVYTPDGPGPFPLVVYFHGGGFVICDLDTHDGLCRALCKATGAWSPPSTIGSPPSTRSPPPVDDAEAATRWASGTPPRSAATRRASSSRATAPAAAWRPSPASASATRAARSRAGRPSSTRSPPATPTRPPPIAPSPTAMA